MKKIIVLFAVFLSILGYSQVTKSSISGVVKSNVGETLPGATVQVVHVPTGTKYFANSDAQGRYGIPAIRPGGPYTVTVKYVGYKTFEETEINAPKPNGLWSMLTMKCPRCRRGNMFTHKSAYRKLSLKYIFVLNYFF